MDTKRTPGFRDNSSRDLSQVSRAVLLCPRTEAGQIFTGPTVDSTQCGREGQAVARQQGGGGGVLTSRSSMEGTGTLGLGEQGRGLARLVSSKPRRALQGSELPECLAPGAERAGFSHYLLCHSKPAGQKFISNFSRVGILFFLKTKKLNSKGEVNYSPGCNTLKS